MEVSGIVRLYLHCPVALHFIKINLHKVMITKANSNTISATGTITTTATGANTGPVEKDWIVLLQQLHVYTYRLVSFPALIVSET